MPPRARRRERLRGRSRERRVDLNGVTVAQVAPRSGSSVHESCGILRFALSTPTQSILDAAMALPEDEPRRAGRGTASASS